MTIRTVGHGALPAADLAGLLTGAGIGLLADVRRFPGSRRHPQFGRAELERWLPEHGVEYWWFPGLGGRRSPAPDSPNTALRNEQFRAYADHMATDEFRAGVDDLLELTVGAGAAVAVICAESVWWRCHRRLLADYLVLVRQVEVEHLFHDGGAVAHTPTPEARIVEGGLVYDEPIQEGLFAERDDLSAAPPPGPRRGQPPGA